MSMPMTTEGYFRLRMLCCGYQLAKLGIKDLRRLWKCGRAVIRQCDESIPVGIKDAIVKRILPDEDEELAEIRRNPSRGPGRNNVQQNESTHLGQGNLSRTVPSGNPKDNDYSQFPSVDGSSIDPSFNPGYRSISSLDLIRLMTNCLSRPFRKVI